MKHVVKAISLTCDGCGQQFETLDGMTCYADDQDGKLIEETARNSDWKTMNGHHYCPSCWERDDDDIIHTKDGRRWDDSSIEVVVIGLPPPSLLPPQHSLHPTSCRPWCG